MDAIVKSFTEKKVENKTLQIITETKYSRRIEYYYRNILKMIYSGFV